MLSNDLRTARRPPGRLALCLSGLAVVVLSGVVSAVVATVVADRSSGERVAPDELAQQALAPLTGAAGDAAGDAAGPTAAAPPSLDGAGGPLPAAPPGPDGPILPMGGMFDFSIFSGQVVSVARAPVQTVVGERGVWVGNGEADRLFVRFDEPGAQMPAVKPGDRISVSGMLRLLPEDAEGAFGIGPGTGLDHLRRQGGYLHVLTVDAA